MKTTTDFEKYIDALPEYDVFNDQKPIGNGKKPKEVDYISYDENNDFRNREVPLPEEEHTTDYNDDFGVYKVHEKRTHNFITLLFFPISILWLEISLRICCNQSVFTGSLFYVLLFTFSFSCFFTLICTFADQKFNRFIANTILIILTFWYAIQAISFNSLGDFINLTDLSLLFNSQFYMGIANSGAALLLLFIPLCLSLLFGRFIFPFKHIFIAGKIFLAVLLVALHFLCIVLIGVDNFTLPKSDVIYYTSTSKTLRQSRFGLLTAEKIDIIDLCSK